MTTSTPLPTAILLGATGLVGSEALKILLSSQGFGEVVAPVRRASLGPHPKLRAPVTDFDRPDASALAGETIFSALGTTLRKAGSAEAFRRTDYDLVMRLLRLAREHGARRAVLVSSVGANPRAKVLYSRVKGELERDAATLGFSELHILRPSLLLGERGELRPAERLSIAIASPLRSWFVGPLAPYRPVHAREVARAMLECLRRSPGAGVHVYEGERLAALY